VGGIFVHEVIGHALEADTVLAGASWLAGACGRLATPELTVVDDPRRGRAAWSVDDEGESSRPIALVRRGSAGEWLHDARTSRLSGQRPTGHGRRGSFRDPVRPRMGCTFVTAGPHHPGAALEGIADGIYVRRMEAASTDPRTGRAAFRVTEADRIVEGQIDGPLVPHLMLVEAPRALASIERIADDLEFDLCAGSCLRDGQSLASSAGSPTFRLRATMVFV
jgi:TldD protein